MMFDKETKIIKLIDFGTAVRFDSSEPIPRRCVGTVNTSSNLVLLCGPLSTEQKVQLKMWYLVVGSHSVHSFVREASIQWKDWRLNPEKSCWKRSRLHSWRLEICLWRCQKLNKKNAHKRYLQTNLSEIIDGPSILPRTFEELTSLWWDSLHDQVFRKHEEIPSNWLIYEGHEKQ